jgi:pimeloyl-ACP methyl ester carboxylesterase
MAPRAKAERLADALRGRGPLALVGFSGGFHLACVIALDGLLPVRRLVGMAPSIGVEPQEEPVYRGFAQLARQQAEVREAMAERWTSPAFRQRAPDVAWRVGGWIQATSPEALAAELEGFAAAGSLDERLKELRIPVGLIFGELDATCSPGKMSSMRGAFQNAVVRELRGAGHACFLEDPDGTEAALVDLLEL